MTTKSTTKSTTQLLPQLEGDLFLSEAGLETDLIFLQDIDLPEFASFPLLASDEGRATLRNYYQSVVDLARRDGRGVVLETPTWRASPDWASELGYSTEELDELNRAAVALLVELRAANPDVPFVVSGNLGPRGDGYVVGSAMTVAHARRYHSEQIGSLAAAGADQITALTLNYATEAIGIVDAANDVGLPCVISFTVELDGALPSGQALADAIEEVDGATDPPPVYFMVNCAHPSHFTDVLSTPGPWSRIRGIRANASRMSHEELDAATELDRGDELELAQSYVELSKLLPELAVVGGCCGTDVHHLGAISAALGH